MAQKLDDDTTTGDSGLFVPIGIGFLCLVIVLVAFALTGAWFGQGTGQAVLEWGLCLVVLVTVGVKAWRDRGGRR